MSLRHALLGLLAEGPASGYELTKRFELSLANVWNAKHSQIYPELQKLAHLGFVEPGEEGPRGRKAYEITDEGRGELRRWLLEERPDRPVRSESMLRIFFLWTLERDEAAAYLEGEADLYAERLAQLRGLDGGIPWDETSTDLMGRLVIEEGVRMTTALHDWARWAAEQVRAGRDATSLRGRLGT